MSGNLLRIIAIVLLIGAILVGWYGYQLSDQPPPSTTTVDKAPVKLQPQVTARQTISAGHVLTMEDLTVDQVRQPNALGFASRSALVGRVVTEQIEAGMPLLATNFPVLGPAAELLRSGERGVSIKVDEVVGVSGFVKPGDHVDVLLYRQAGNEAVDESSAQVVLRDVRVIGFGQEIQQEQQIADETKAGDTADKAARSLKNSDKTGASSRSAILAVNERDMTKLMLAANSGSLRLALRGAEPPAVTTEPAVTNNNPTAIVKLSELAGNEIKPSPAVAAKAKTGRQLQKPTPASTVILYNGDKPETLHFKGN